MVWFAKHIFVKIINNYLLLTDDEKVNYLGITLYIPGFQRASSWFKKI